MNQFVAALPRDRYIESKYYGPYNTLSFVTCFPLRDGFQIVPQFKRPQRVENVDFHHHILCWSSTANT